MKSTVSFSKTCSLFVATVIVGTFIFLPFLSEAKESRGVVYVDPELNVVGVFPQEYMAQDLADTMNEGPLSEGAVKANVGVDEETGYFKVYLETTKRITNLKGGCLLSADELVVRKGQEVTFAWEADTSELNCTPGENECGVMSEVALQEKGVEGDSITLPVDETTVYVLSAQVTDQITYEDDEEPEIITKPAVCTVEVQVTNWFKWVLWKLFSVKP